MDYVRLKPRALWEMLIGVPLIKASLSLMTGTLVTSSLGLVFWILAARLYEPADFGNSSTAVYTLMMIADVACLGLRTGLVRFIPTAGHRTGRTIVWGYSMVVAASTLVALAFLAGLGIWAPELGALRSSLVVGVFFVGSTVCWALFMLEDAVLVGLRRAPWVLIENTLFGVLKIVLLFPLASLSPDYGIFWAWTLPVFPIVVGVNLLMARLPEARVGTESSAVEIEGGESDRGLLKAIVSFSLADWFAAIARLVALGVIPLIVLARLGSEFAAYFQSSWLIAFVIFSLSTNAAYALLAETSYDKAKLNRNSMQALVLSLALTVPIALVGLVGAGLVLRIYGADYAANGANLLRILLVAAVPNVVYQLYIGRLRSQSRMLAVVLIEVTLSVVVLGLVWVMIPRFGLNGVGFAWLLGLGAMACLALANESVWWWAARLDTGLVRRLSRTARRLPTSRPRRALESRLKEVANHVGAVADPMTVDWAEADAHVQRARLVLEDGRRLSVSLASTAAGGKAIDANRRILTELRQDPALETMSPLLPAPVGGPGCGADGWVAWFEPATPTVTATQALAQGSGAAHIIAAIADAVEPLHRATALPIMVDELLVDSWIEDSLDRLAVAGRGGKAQIDRVRQLLKGGFVGRVVDVGVVHGALTTDNVLVTADRQPVVAGLVGWERSATMPIVVDRVTLALSELSARSEVELGELVARLLDDPSDIVEHPAMLRSDGRTPLDTEPDPRSVLLLTWIQLIGAPVESSRAVGGDVFWLARNAQPVLAKLEPGASRSDRFDFSGKVGS